MTTDLNKSCAEANKRVENWISKSAGQHRRAMNAQIVQTHAEAEYAKPNHGYVDLDQRNSDGTSPHAEVRELLLDGVYVVGALAALIFVIFALLGYWSNK